jgi:uncharacterized protein
MDMQGSRLLHVTQQQAWEALNDPEVLKACIPGCDKIEAKGENQFAIGMAVKIGPVSAKFTGNIRLSDITPPRSYTLSFDGQGGVAGFGKGSAAVKLLPQEVGCEMQYTANAQVGGKIAQMGQRLIDGVAKSMAEDFFKRFDVEMQLRYPSDQTLPQSGVQTSQPSRVTLPRWVWIAIAVLLLSAIWKFAK